MTGQGPRIGFIGQGWIGKSYADDFEQRGFSVVRYALEEPYAKNKDLVSECDIVFIAVPTPTRANGFDDSIVRAVLPLLGKGKTAVIKSTLLPGTTEALQASFPDIFILHSPEFLREKSAAHDAANPQRNLIGIPVDDARYRAAADAVLSVLPPAPYAKVLPSRSAELVKYAGNVFLATKVVFANMLYDLSDRLGASYEEVREALSADPRIGPSHLSPIDASGHTEKAGRGAGGDCFIKDTEAFRRLYGETVGDAAGAELLLSLIRKNNVLLTESEKDLEILRGVYGDTLP